LSENKIRRRKMGESRRPVIERILKKIEDHVEEYRAKERPVRPRSTRAGRSFVRRPPSGSGSSPRGRPTAPPSRR
jgi:hypothetical protein